MQHQNQSIKNPVNTNTNPARLKDLEKMLPRVMAADRYRMLQKISRIRQILRNKKAHKKASAEISILEKDIQGALQKKERRIQFKPQLIYNQDLPIYQKREEIISAIRENPVVIISGETGSGKTTQIPKFCLEAGQGFDGKIGCTQPRRIAAVTVAQRISEELKQTLGTNVGYKIRFTDKTHKNAYIKVMTDGILLAETHRDPYLTEYDTLIIDEAHERSLNIDFILGILKTLLRKRKDLKLIITSATIDTEKFSAAFNMAPIIEVSGRMYPVDVKYMPFEDEDADENAPSYVEKAIEAVDYLLKALPRGDILIFMPTQQDIMETREILEGRKYPGVRVMPLFARLTAQEQIKVFSKISGRKIIIATNIAETSITIPGIKYVIDTGLARIPKYTPRTRTTSLKVSPVSKSSADQRKGRCGRVANGVCIRLYSEDDYLTRQDFTPPEILRANLAEVILKMMALRIGDIWDFPFIDAPAPKSISDGFDLLSELNAITPIKSTVQKTQKTEYHLTDKGRQMALIPLDPRLSCMLLEAHKQYCEKEIIVIASALSIMDPKERPLEKAQAADAAHAVFTHPSSDFMGLLNVWNRFHLTLENKKTNSQMRKYCKENFLSFKRMREWRDVHSQLEEILNQEADRIKKTVHHKPSLQAKEDLLYSSIHKSILSGFLSNIALKKENNFYTAAKNREVMIFPGSTLFNKNKPWIVSAEIVETNRVYARTTAAIDPAWIESLAKNICAYTYINPRWDKKRGEVVATEQVSLFGLIIASDRLVSYGKVNPDEATKIFIQSALVEGQMDIGLPFMIHNQKLMDQAIDIENRLRRKDVRVDDAMLFDFYQDRLKGCYGIKTLKKIIKETPGDDFLKMTSDNVFHYFPDQETLNQYPDAITLGNQNLDCEYTFDPGNETDGVTVKIPSSIASSVSTEEIDWLVPGLFTEKISALIKGLPKNYRKQLIPISDTVEIIVNEIPKEKGPLLTLLGKFIYDRFKVDIPHSHWPENQLPEYLNMRISVVDKHGREITSSRDKSILSHSHENDSHTDIFGPIRRKWERNGITRWDFPDLPDSIDFKTSDGVTWTLFPGLAINENSALAEDNMEIGLRLFADAQKALISHKTGVAGLYSYYFSKDIKFLKKALMIPRQFKAPAKLLGGKNQLETLLYREVMNRLFSGNIRTKKVFESHGEKMALEILPKGQELMAQMLPTIEAYHDTCIALDAMKIDSRFNAVVIKFLEDITAQAERLVPHNFISVYAPDRLKHLDRYLKALVIRAKRALLDLEKDRMKASDLIPHVKNLDSLTTSLSPNVSDQKREAVEEYFWLIEEYKVSVFAQELKTAVTVSSKILSQKFDAIQRMA